MDEKLLQFAMLLAYGPFFLMLFVFCVGLILKWAGDSSFLNWLIRRTEAQKPLSRKPKQPGRPG
jgi:hypothetical protein